MCKDSAFFRNFVAVKKKKTIMYRLLRYFLLSTLLVPATILAQPLRVGVMLPLHNDNGDGRRMVEYYRGLLMGCDSLKKNGMSINIHAWNVAENADIQQTLADPDAAKCDLIIGPLYSKQVKALSEFVEKHNIKLLIPFSIHTSELQRNGNIYQVYQDPATFNESVIARFMQNFKEYHPVIIDCKDSTSTKGAFTGSLRRHLEATGINHHITNIKSTEDVFQNAFSQTQPNVVILNTSRLQELGVVFAKLNSLKVQKPDLELTVFGYTEWLGYTRNQLENFYKFNVHIPSPYYYNPLTSRTQRVQQKYRWNFHQDMMQTQPRFAITGFDHALFFIQGLKLRGKRFTGEYGSIVCNPIQTPLQFSRIGNGGWQNHSLVFVHYTPEHRIETLQY